LSSVRSEEKGEKIGARHITKKKRRRTGRLPFRSAGGKKKAYHTKLQIHSKEGAAKKKKKGASEQKKKKKKKKPDLSSTRRGKKPLPLKGKENL